MSHLDKCLDYLATLNEAAVLLNTVEYTKFCAIHDKVLDIAKKINFKPCEEILGGLHKERAAESCETVKNEAA